MRRRMRLRVRYWRRDPQHENTKARRGELEEARRRPRRRASSPSLEREREKERKGDDAAADYLAR
jgi:hypothetical protein